MKLRHRYSIWIHVERTVGHHSRLPKHSHVPGRESHSIWRTLHVRIFLSIWNCSSWHTYCVHVCIQTTHIDYPNVANASVPIVSLFHVFSADGQRASSSSSFVLLLLLLHCCEMRRWDHHSVRRIDDWITHRVKRRHTPRCHHLHHCLLLLMMPRSSRRHSVTHLRYVS